MFYCNECRIGSRKECRKLMNFSHLGSRCRVKYKRCKCHLYSHDMRLQSETGEGKIIVFAIIKRKFLHLTFTSLLSKYVTSCFIDRSRKQNWRRNRNKYACSFIDASIVFSENDFKYYRRENRLKIWKIKLFDDKIGTTPFYGLW